MATLIKYKQLLLNGKIVNNDLAGSITTAKLLDGASFIKRDGTVVFTSNQSMGSNKLTALANGTNATDAINKSQLDALELDIDSQITALELLIADGMKTPIAFDASAVSVFPTHPKGTTMKVTVAGTVSGIDLEIGDTIIYDSTGSSPYVVQTNIDSASETVNGFIKLSTTAQVTSAIDDSTAVTPLKLGQKLATLLTSLDSSYVRFDIAQTITTPQKTTARTNIGAASDSEVVKLTGTQTIAGIKTFSSSPVVPTATLGTQAVNLGQVEALVSSSGLDKLYLNETPTGTINGTNKTFTLANSAVAGKLIVRLNGQTLTLTDDYTHSGATITFVNAPDIVGANDIIRCDYVKV